jgi:hypothetical protein
VANLAARLKAAAKEFVAYDLSCCAAIDSAALWCNIAEPTSFIP